MDFFSFSYDILSYSKSHSRKISVHVKTELQHCKHDTFIQHSRGDDEKYRTLTVTSQQDLQPIQNKDPLVQLFLLHEQPIKNHDCIIPKSPGATHSKANI